MSVCVEQKSESASEKLLGIVVNNNATLRNHFYGDTEHTGLFKQITTRVNILKRLRRFMTPARLKLIMDCLFTSNLSYGMTVSGLGLAPTRRSR